MNDACSTTCATAPRTSRTPPRATGKSSSESCEKNFPTSSEEEAERLAEDICRRCGASETTPPSEMARRLGFDVRFRALPRAFKGISILGETTILVSPSGSTARDEATIAHELCELHLPQKLSPAFHEAFCERAGAALLLQRDPFLAAGFACHWDLPHLRQRWAWASWELLMRRAVELMPGSAASHWRRGKLQCRHHNGWALQVSPDESKAIQAAHVSGTGIVLSRNRQTRAWKLANSPSWVAEWSLPRWTALS